MAFWFTFGSTIAKIEGIKSVFHGDEMSFSVILGCGIYLKLNSQKNLTTCGAKWALLINPHGQSVGVQVRPPFLCPKFMDYAKKLPNNLKINEKSVKRVQMGPSQSIRKVILIPKDVIRRPKAPLEQGTGTTVLTDYFGKEISDKEFAERKKQVLEEDAFSYKQRTTALL